MTQRRSPRVGIEDTWWTRRSDSGERTKTKRHGRGKRYRVRWVDDLGKEQTKGFSLRREAQVLADDLKASMTVGLYRDPAKARTPLSETLERHLAALAGEVKTDTLREYRRIANYRLFPAWGSRPLDSIRLSEVQAWLGGLREEGLGESSLRNHGLLLRAALETAVKDRFIAENPLKHLKLPTVKNSRQGKPFTASQLEDLVSWMPTQADKGFTLVMGRCGLRPGEAMALQAKSVDLERAKITISRRYSERGGSLHADTPKSGKRRMVPMPDDVANALAPLLADKLPEADVFTGGRGGTLRMSNWRTRKFEKALVDLGLDADHIPYDLRHTFASLAVRAGWNVKMLQTVMGHADISTTMRHYAHLFEDDHERMLRLLNQTPAYPLRTAGNGERPQLHAVGT